VASRTILHERIADGLSAGIQAEASGVVELYRVNCREL
jgi:hypothetical protein